MLTPEGRAALTDVQDHLIELVVERNEAGKAGDQERVGDLRAEIDRLHDECDQIRHSEH